MLTAHEASMLVHAFACNARIEGMKAENAHRESCGNGVAYGEDAFFAEAFALEQIADTLRN